MQYHRWISKKNYRILLAKRREYWKRQKEQNPSYLAQQAKLYADKNQYSYLITKRK